MTEPSLDLLLRDGRFEGERVDIGVRAGIVTSLHAQGPAIAVEELGGRLVTPPLVEPHIHLDAVLTEGQPRPNRSGSLFEGIAVWGERVGSLTAEDVTARAAQVLRWQLACGVQHVRSHVDVCDRELTALRALIELRAAAQGQVDLQLVAFPQQGILGWDGGPGAMRRACELGVDVVGAIPHFELTREDGVASVVMAFDLAEEFGLRVDIHCDETDDEHSRFVEVMAAQTIRRGMAGRVTASHTTAMHSYGAAYASRLIANIARSGMAMTVNPLDNAVLQGRFDTGPIRRGHTRVKQLQEAGVTVAIGHDSVLDPWYPLGFGDPVQAAFVLVHLGHMSGADDIARLLKMITAAPAEVLGLESYGLRVGGPADLVVHDAPGWPDALRLGASRTLVLRGGRVVARSAPRSTEVVWDGASRPVDFLR